MYHVSNKIKTHNQQNLETIVDNLANNGRQLGEQNLRGDKIPKILAN